MGVRSMIVSVFVTIALLLAGCGGSTGPSEAPEVPPGEVGPAAPGSTSPEGGGAVITDTGVLTE